MTEVDGSEETEAAEETEPAPPRWDERLVGWWDALLALRTRLAAPTAELLDDGWSRFVAPFRPLWSRWESATLLRRKVPVGLLVLVVVWYAVVFGRLVFWRHERFGSFDYDLGMYDQGIWQLAHGRGYMTVRGMQVFGHHANLGYLLFVPFYWVGIGGPHFLNFVNLATVVGTAVPVFLLGRRHLRSEWAGLAFVIAYLFHFMPQWMIQETFHPESMAVLGLASAWYAASIGRWRWYWAWVVFALIWKEDVAIAVMVLGVAIAFAYKVPRRGLWTAALGAIWFVVATRFFMPLFQQGDAVYDGLFGQLGATTTDVIHTSIVHPSRLIETLRCHGVFDGKPKPAPVPIQGVDCAAQMPTDNLPPRGWATMAQPYGLLPAMASPHVAAVGVPQHVVNYSTTADFTWSLLFHYAFIPYLGVLLATVHTATRRVRPVFAWMIIVVMLVGVGVTNEKGVGPWTSNGSAGFWPLTDNPKNDDRRALLAKIPDEAGVSTHYYLVPHLTHRERIYTFPNPWRSNNYGVGGVPAPPDPRTAVDWLLVDRDDLGNPDDLALYDSVLADEDWVLVEKRDTLELHRRS